MTDPIQQQLITSRENQILDAAAVVFASKGFHPTTIRDVAKQAGIADGTIYNYFANKTALLLGMFQRMQRAALADAPLPTDGVDMHGFIRAALQRALLAQQADNFALFRIVVSEMLVNEELRALYYQQILEPTLALAEPYMEAQLAQLGSSPANAKLAVRVISGMVLGLTLQRIMGDPLLAEQWEELPDLLADLLVAGLAAATRTTT